MAFIFKVYLSRSLGAEAVGLYQICLSVFFLLTALAASGIPLVLSRKIAGLPSPDNKKSSSFITAGLIICCGSAIVIIGLFYASNNFLGGLFSDERCKPLFLLMLPALISTVTYCVLRSWFLGAREYAVFSFTELLEELFRVLFSVLLAGGIFYSLKGAKGIALAFTLSDFASAIALVILYFKRQGRFVMPSSFKELTKASTPISLMRIFGSLVGSATAILIPARLIDAGMLVGEATAAFGRVSGMALPLIMVPTALTGALAIVLIPEIVMAYNKKGNGLKNKIEGSILFTFFISALFCVLYIPLGAEITELVFGDAIAGEFVKNCAMLIFPVGLSQITNSILNSLGFEKTTFKNFIIGTVLLFLSLIFAPKYIGIYAVALGFGLCYTVVTILNILQMKKTADFSIASKKLLLLTAFIIPPSLLSYWLKQILLPYLPAFAVITICGAIGLTMFVSLCLIFKIIDFNTVMLKPKFQQLFSKRIRVI